MFRKILFVLAAAAICTLAASGCKSANSTPTAPKPKLKEIEKTPAEKEKEQLLKQLDRIYDDAETHYRLGKLYQADGLWKQAEHSYRNALTFDPVHRQAQAARVKVLLNAGDTQQAQYSASFYITQASATASGSLRLALAFQEQNLDDYALTCYRQALNLAPNSAKIPRQIGFYYLAKNQMVQAQEYLTRSFQLNPNQPDVAHELGRMGVEVKIPQKVQRDTRNLDKMVDEADKN